MRTYVSRMAIYLSEMMPLPGHSVIALLTYAGIAGFAREVQGLTTSILTIPSLVGAWSVLNVFLMLRLMDELKDRDIDRELFPDRPLPAGRVCESDIKISLVLTIIIFVAANLLVVAAVWSALIVLGYALLMFRLFFIPAILRRSLPLSLATHAPIVPLLVLHGFSIFAAEHALSFRHLNWILIAPFVVMIWAGFESWELSRKIRSPEEEGAYVTYSRVFGRVGSVLIASGVELLSTAIGVCLFVVFGLSGIYLVILAVGLAVALWANGRFLIWPSPRTSNLKPFAAAFCISVLLAQTVEFALIGQREV